MLENLVESGQNLENMMKKTWKNIWKPMEQKYMVENVEKNMEKRVGKPKLPSRYGKEARRTHGNKMDSVGKELKRGVCVFQLNVETSLNLSNQKYYHIWGKHLFFYSQICNTDRDSKFNAWCASVRRVSLRICVGDIPPTNLPRLAILSNSFTCFPFCWGTWPETEHYARGAGKDTIGNGL